MHYINRSLTENEQQAISSLISSIGEFNFKISTLLKAINANDAESIAKQWIRWANVDGKIDASQHALRLQELELFFK